MSGVKASVVKHEVNKYPASYPAESLEDEEVTEPQQAEVLQSDQFHEGEKVSEDVVDQPKTAAAPVKLPKFLLKPDKQGAYC